MFQRTSSQPITITPGKRTRDLLDLFREDPPAIRFTDGGMLVGADLASAPAMRRRSSTWRMIALSWDGVDITKESQGPEQNSRHDPACNNRAAQGRRQSL